MGRLSYTAWLAGQALSVLFYYWPVTLVLVIGLVVALARKSPPLGAQFRLRHLFVLTPLIVTLLILLWGMVMEHPSNSQTLAPSWPSYVVLALLVGQVLVSIWVVWAMKGYRWVTAFMVALEQWFGLACAFVATMSVSGDWL